MNILRTTGPILLFLLTALSPAVFADNSGIRELRVELRNKAIACARKGDDSCAQICENAMRSVLAGEDDWQRTVAECEEAHSGIAAAQQAAAEGRALRAGYQWMPDVVATIRAAGGGRLSNPFVVTGRDNDWGRYCKTGLRYMAGVTTGEGGALLSKPGTKVVLKHVQYTTERKRTGQCVVGRIEAYGGE